MELKTVFDIEKDMAEIDAITSRFFSLFTNKNNQVPNINDLKSISIKQALIISSNNSVPIIYDLDSFIKPRAEMLTNGTLTDFVESEVSHKTEIFGNIAQRFSRYEKSGNLNGTEFKSKGSKTLQFVRVDGVWKLSSIAWSDEK